ncbi:hypothetical protein MNR02_14625 [Shinella sp. H4-D48]|uniref:hypothetical protein n=1 Tax=Shinella sp. H4-D48 TaxID=2925841 RepID=UPI001F52EBBD|nr:hypothetical protein [Shinella sp. H4-D48]UNK37683.1 hypothetical protein MNR02_14625 [Shinella sp. H4-D48]
MLDPLLIVEDNDFKYQQILTVLDADTPLLRVKTFKAALPQVRTGTFSAIILDMTFQVLETTGQTDSLEALAGLQLLQYMKRIGKRTPVIVTTQHTTFHQPGTATIQGVEALDDLLKAGFSGFYIGCVYMAEGNGWEKELVQHMQGIKK